MEKSFHMLVKNKKWKGGRTKTDERWGKGKREKKEKIGEGGKGKE
jgi:hypothetical protein